MTRRADLRCTILLFGPLAEAAGRREVTIALPPGAVVADLWTALAAALPDAASAISQWRGRTAHAREHRYVGVDSPVNDGDVIALVPPVSGG